MQVAVAPRSLVGYLTAGATPVWLLGSFAVLSLLYRAGATSGAQAPHGAERAYAALGADGAPISAAQLAESAGLSPSYARALAAEFAARPTSAAQRNGMLASRPARGGGR